MNVENIKVVKVTEPLTKTEAIIKAGKLLVEGGYVTEPYVEKMLEREEIVTTYIGNNLAIPHGTSGTQDMIIESGISVLQVPNGVDFGNHNIAYLVVGIAGKDGTHMDILSKIAIACSDVNVVKEVAFLENTSDVVTKLLGE